MNREDFIKQHVEAWGAPLVARREFARFSGGIYAPGTLANADSLGRGPEGRVRIGKNTAYPTDKAAAWLYSRVQPQ